MEKTLQDIGQFADHHHKYGNVHTAQAYESKTYCVAGMHPVLKCE